MYLGDQGSMRITNLTLLLLCTCWCVPLAVVGQTNFLPGYYINNKSSDTIRCLIEYRSADRMAKYIRVKRTTNSKLTELHPADVKLIAVGGNNFYEPLSYAPPEGEPVTGFFKKIVTGRMTLYRYNDRY